MSQFQYYMGRRLTATSLVNSANVRWSIGKNMGHSCRAGATLDEAKFATNEYIAATTSKACLRQLGQFNGSAGSADGTGNR